jgi:hypothetical protein
MATLEQTLILRVHVITESEYSYRVSWKQNIDETDRLALQELIAQIKLALELREPARGLARPNY